MSVEIDKRVVEMQFDNKQFERNVQTSLSTLDKLKMALNFDGAKGLDSITQAAKKMDLSNITNQTERVQVSFSALQVAGMTMVSELTKSFMNFGKNLWNMSFGQIKSGGMGRALKIEQADFKMKALVDKMDRFKDDSAAATQYIKEMGDAIDWAVTGTAYGYDSAASVAAQLMASGHDDVEKMRKDLRAVAGAAAMTGRSYDDMGRIFAAVAGQGRMMGDQLLQFSAGGINAAATIADYLGKSEKEVRDMVSKGKIDFQTFSDAMYEAYGEAAGKADETYAGVLSNVKAQLSRLGQRFAQPYIKNMIPFLQQVKASIKQISATLAPVAERWDKLFGKITTWGANVLKSINYQKFTVVFRGIENLIWGVVIVLHTLKEAFKEVFPPKTANEIMEAAYAFERFTENILPTKEAVAGLKGLFTALLAPFKIVLKLFSTLSKYIQPVIVAALKIVYAFVSVFEILEPLALGLLDFIDSMGILEGVINFVTTAMIYCAVALRVLVELFVEFVKKVAYSERLQRIVDTLKNMGYVIATYLVEALTYVLSIIDGIFARLNNASGGTTFFDQLINNATLLWNVIVSLGESFAYWLNTADSAQGMNAIVSFFKELGKLIGNFFTGKDVSQNINGMADALGKLKDRIKEMWEQFKAAWDSIDKGEVIMLLFAVTILSVSMALKHLIDNIATFAIKMADIPGILKDLREAIRNIGNFAGPAQTILAFSVAVAVITNALITLSNVSDQDALKRSAIILGSLGAGMLAFVLALEIFSKKIDRGTEEVIDRSALNLLAITGSMVALVLSLKMLVELKASTEDMVRSIGAIIVLMGSLILAMKLLTKFVPELKGGSIAFLAFAAGTLVLVKAIQILDKIPLEHITESLSGLATVLIGFGFAIGLAGKASGWASLAIMAFTTSLVVLMGMFLVLAFIPYDIITNAVEKAKAIFEAFIPLIMIVGIATRLAGKGELGGNLWAIILSLTAFFGAFIVFTKLVNTADAWGALAVMTVYISIISVFLAVLVFIESKISESARKSRDVLRNANQAEATFAGLSKVLTAIGVAMLGIGLAAKLMAKVPPETLKSIGWYLTAILVTIAGMEAMYLYADGTNKSKAGIFNLLSIISGVGLIIGALVALQWADETKLVIASTAMSVCMLALAVMISAISGIKEVTVNKAVKTIPMISLLVLSLGGLAAAIAYSMVIMRGAFENLDSTTTNNMFLAMAAGIAGLITLMLVLLVFVRVTRKKFKSKDLLAVSGAMLLLGSVYAVIGASMLIMRKAFNKVSDNAMAAMLVWSLVLLAALAGVMVALGFLVSYIVSPTDLLLISASMIALGAVFSEIGAAFLIMKQAFDQVTPATMDEMFRDLSLLFIAMMGTLALLGALTYKIKAIDYILIGAAMNLLALSIIEIAGAFAILKSSGASPDEITAYAIAFGIFLAATAAISAVLGYFAPAAIGLIALGTAFLFIGNAVKNIGTGILDVANAVQILGSVSSEEMDQFIENTKTFFSRFDEIADALNKGFPAMEAAIRMHLIDLGLLIGEFIGLITAAGIAAFVQALYENIDVILKGVALILGVIVDWLQLPETQELIYNAFKVLADSALSALDGLIEGLTGIPNLIRDIIGAAEGATPGEDLIAGTREAFEEWFNGDRHDFDKWKNTYKAVIGELAEYSKIPFEEMTDAQRDALKELSGWADELMQEATKNEWYLTLDERLFGLDKKSDITKSYVRMFSEIYESLDKDQEAFDRFLMSLYAYGDEIERLPNNSNVHTSYIEDIYGSNDFWDNQFYHVKEFEGKADEAKTYIQDLFNTRVLNDNMDYGLQSDLDYLGKYLKTISQDYQDIATLQDLISGNIHDNQYNMLTSRIEETINKDIENSKYTIQDAEDALKKFNLSGTYYIDDLGIHFRRSAEDAESIGYSFEDANTRSEKSFDNFVNNFVNNTSTLADRMAEPFNKVNEAYAGVGTYIARHPVRPRVDAAGIHLLNSEVQLTNAKLKGLTQNSTTTAIYGLSTMKGLGKAAIIAKGDISSVNSKLDDTADSTDDTTEAVDDFNNAVDELTSRTPGIRDFFNTFINGARQASPALDKALNTVDQYLGKVNDSNRSAWTSDQWRDYGMEDVRKDLANGQWYYAHRYEVEGYKDIEAYVNANSHYGKDVGYDIMGWIEEKANEAKESLKDFLPNVDDLTGSLDDFTDSASDAAEETDKLGDSIKSTLDVFTEFNTEAKTSSRTIFKNFESQIDGIKKWQGELEELATRGMNQNFLKELADEGPAAYDKIHAFYTMSSNELALFNRMYAEKLVLQDDTADHIRQSFVDAGIMFQDEADAMAKSIGDRYDAAVLKAQAEAASKKNGQMTAATKKRLAQMYAEIEKYQADTEFIEKWYDSNAAIGETAGEAIATTAEETLNNTIIGTAAYKEAGKEMVELIGEGITSASPDIIKGMEDLGKASMETLKASLEFEKVLEPINQFRSSVYEQVEGSLKLFDEVKQKTAKEEKESQISATQMLYNMAENAKKIGRWATNLKTLAAKGMSEGLLEELRKLGPEGADKVDAFVRMTSDQLKKANSLYDSSTNLAGYVSDKLTSTYAEQGFAMSLGLKKGINEGKNDILAQMYEIGLESSEGFKNGIDPDAAKQAMELLGTNTLVKLCEVLDIHSPSRETYAIGVNTVLGLKNGIEDPEAVNELMTSIADFGLKIKEAYKESTDEKYLNRPDILNEDAYEPVIRPLVDMSGVEAGINSFFANRQFSLSGTISNAMAAQNKGPSADAIMITTAVKELGSRVDRLNNSVNELRQGQAETRNAIRGIDIRLDTGALVGGIVNQMDSALGSKAVRVKRRKG